MEKIKIHLPLLFKDDFIYVYTEPKPDMPFEKNDQVKTSYNLTIEKWQSSKIKCQVPDDFKEAIFYLVQKEKPNLPLIEFVELCDKGIDISELAERIEVENIGSVDISSVVGSYKPSELKGVLDKMEDLIANAKPRYFATLKPLEVKIDKPDKENYSNDSDGRAKYESDLSDYIYSQRKPIEETVKDSVMDIVCHSCKKMFVGTRYENKCNKCKSIDEAESSTEIPNIKLGQIFKVDGKMYIINLPTKDTQLESCNEHKHLVTTLFNID